MSRVPPVKKSVLDEGCCFGFVTGLIFGFLAAAVLLVSVSCTPCPCSPPASSSTTTSQEPEEVAENRCGPRLARKCVQYSGA